MKLKHSKKTKIQATIISRKRLSQHRGNLIKSGIPVEELDLTFLATFFNQIKADISSISDEVGLKLEEIKLPEPTIVSAQSKLSEAKTKLQELDKQKFGLYKKLQSIYSQLKSIRNDLKEAIEEVSKLEVKDPSVLSEERRRIEEEISSIDGDGIKTCVLSL